MLIRKGDEYKTGFLTLYRQYFYKQISQGLKKSLYIYSMFSNLVFSLIPRGTNTAAMPSLISQYSDALFEVFINDYIKAIVDFEMLYDFLHI